MTHPFPLLLLLTAVFVGACAPMVPIEPVSFSPDPAGRSVRQIRLQSPLAIRLSSGYVRTLPANSVWRQAGRVAHGEVYRPVDSVLTIEGRQVHEAYLVVSGTMLMGFYLPGESNYSPLLPAVPLHLGDTP